MSWKKLDIDDLKLLLAQDEIEKLSELSLDPEITAVINSIIDMVAAMWRGALRAKGYSMDIRDGYIPDAYQYWVLVHSRYAVWSRFPNSQYIAIDEVRKDEYKKALELLKDPYIDVAKPEWEYDPANPENQGEQYWHAAASIVVPYPQAFEAKPNIYKNLWN